MNDIKTITGEKIISKIVNWCIVVLIGIILSIAFASMHSSGRWNLDKFYDVGEVNDLWLRTNETNGLVYQTNEYLLHVNEKYATISFINNNTSIGWRYLYFYTENLPLDKIDAKLQLHDKQGVLIYQSAIEIFEGENAIAVYGDEIYKVTFVFEGEAEYEFNLYKLQLRENVKYVSGRRLLLEFVITFFIYMVMATLVYCYCKAKNIHWKRILLLEGVQQVYIEIFSGIGKKIEKIPDKYRSAWRITCLLMIFINMLVTTKYGDYLQQDYYKYYIGVQLLLLILWGLTNMKHEMRLISGNNRLTIAWETLCVLMCISDFIVEKKFAYTGIWMLLVVTFVYFSWNNMDEPVKALTELVVVVRIIFIVSCVYSIFFELYMGTNYIGMTQNPNTLGEFMTMVCVIEYSVLDERLYDSRKAYILNVIELIVAVSFIEMSGCRAARMTFAILTFGFVAKIVGNMREKKYRRNVLLAFLIAVLAYLPVSSACSWAASNLPKQSASVNEMENVLQVTGNKDVVYAASLEKQKTYEQLDTYSSGRLTIWKKYLSELNLWGHYGDQNVDGAVKNEKIGAHNMFITIAYRYGVFCVVPFVVLTASMVVYGFIYMIKKCKIKETYALILLQGTIAYSLIAFWGNIEQPFRYMPWIIFYLLVGYAMVQTGRMKSK